MFEITIRETKTTKKLTGKEWKVIDEVSMFPDDQERYHIKKDVYGYTPEIQKEVEVSREIFRQEVEGADLIKIIKAINNIPILEVD